MRIIVIFMCISIFCSCASVSKSPYACSTSADSQVLANGKMGTYFLGNVFQYGDCAISERLRVENGNFIKYKSDPIKNQIINDSLYPKKDLMAIFEMFGCDIEDEKLLIEFANRNYGEVFENLDRRSGRESMLLIRSRIKQDPEISEICFR